MKLPFIKKKPVEEPSAKKEDPKETRREQFSITITLSNGEQFSYRQIDELNSGRTCIGCFLPFYRWFYEKFTPYYTFEYDKGADIIIRSEVKSVRMKREEITMLEQEE